MRRHNIIIAATALSVIAAACSHSDVATPRRNAYPRLDLPDSTYSAATIAAPLNFEVNSAAVVVADTTAAAKGSDSQWYNIVYPTLGNTTIFTTFTPAHDELARKKIIDNRAERMSLNTGGNHSEIVEFKTPAGYDATIITTPVGTITPVQFMAVGERWVVSGSYLISETDAANPDSIRPAIDAVKRDIIHTINSLQ